MHTQHMFSDLFPESIHSCTAKYSRRDSRESRSRIINLSTVGSSATRNRQNIPGISISDVIWSSMERICWSAVCVVCCIGACLMLYVLCNVLLCCVCYCFRVIILWLKCLCCLLKCWYCSVLCRRMFTRKSARWVIVFQNDLDAQLGQKLGTIDTSELMRVGESAGQKVDTYGCNAYNYRGRVINVCFNVWPTYG